MALAWTTTPFYGIKTACNALLGGSKKYLLPGGLDLDDEVRWISVHTVWACHGVVAALGSVFTGPLGGSSLTHWWVEIETKHAYYCAQFDYDEKLTLTKHDSSKMVRERGKTGASCGGEDKDVSIKSGYGYKKPNYRKMKDIVRFMERYNGTYHLVNNNSQDFASALYKYM